jgi:hypothetical protein
LQQVFHLASSTPREPAAQLLNVRISLLLRAILPLKIAALSKNDGLPLPEARFLYCLFWLLLHVRGY